MSTHRYFDRIAAATMTFAMILTVLFMNGEKFGLMFAVDIDAEAHSDDSYFTGNDLDADWDTTDASEITLQGNTASFSNSGCYLMDGNVVIAKSGKYTVSGTLADGSLIIDAEDNSKIWILFDGVQIEREDGACLIVEQADKVFLTLAEGSENVLTCGASPGGEALEDQTDGTIFTHDDLTINGRGLLEINSRVNHGTAVNGDLPEDQTGGAIFTHDDLTINGRGSLEINARDNHGIAANDDLVIAGGKITISAPKDAVHANDSIRIVGADLNITAGDDGLVADNEDAYVYIESGEITIRCADEGINAAGDVLISGGTITVSTDTGQGHHGIKAGNTCKVTGGVISIDSCYEGIQALHVDILGGDISIYPSDDGINASSVESEEIFEMGQMQGGSALEAITKREDTPGLGAIAKSEDTPGLGAITKSEDTPGLGTITKGADISGQDNNTDVNPWIHISSGTLLIENGSGIDADGLDSNGDIVISGGVIRISLNDDGYNKVIDCGSENNGICVINGGTVIACGSSSSAESISTESKQGSILLYTRSTVKEGSRAALLAKEGNPLLEWTVPHSYSLILLSCPEMHVGETYHIVTREESEEVSMTEAAMTVGWVR